jgi:hypothetical protein
MRRVVPRLKAVLGLVYVLIRGCIRDRGSTLPLGVGVSGRDDWGRAGGYRWKEDEVVRSRVVRCVDELLVRGLIGVAVRSIDCWRGKPRWLGLGKPSLGSIRDERL